MYQFGTNPQSTVDARESDTPLLAVSIQEVILRLCYRSRLIFLIKMPSYVFVHDETPSKDERKSPERYKCKITL